MPSGSLRELLKDKDGYGQKLMLRLNGGFTWSELQKIHIGRVDFDVIFTPH